MTIKNFALTFRTPLRGRGAAEDMLVPQLSPTWDFAHLLPRNIIGGVYRRPMEIVLVFVFHVAINAQSSRFFKGTVRPVWICMRVVSLDRPWKGYQPLLFFNFFLFQFWIFELLWFVFRDVGIFYSATVFKRTIVDFPAFLEHSSAEKIAICDHTNRDPNKQEVGFIFEWSSSELWSF
jgi:hypothetical protein